MKYVKNRDEVVRDINEMAKGWPVGSVAKFNDISDPSKRRYRDWESWRPTQAPKINNSDGAYYLEITESGREWLVGKILFQNGIADPNESGYRYRVRARYAMQPTSEYKILDKNKEEISKLMNKSFFLDGTEPGIIGHDGEKAIGITEAEYTVRSLNFKLTDLYDEPVFCLFTKGSDAKANKSFSIKLSEINSLTAELSKEQREVIAEWFTKKLDTIITVDSDNRFSFSPWKVVGSRNDVFPLDFSAGPFLTKKQAESVLDIIKEQDITLYNPTSLRLETVENRWSTINMKLEQLVEYAKAIGVETTMKELLALRRGTAIGKKFGI